MISFFKPFAVTTPKMLAFLEKEGHVDDGLNVGFLSCQVKGFNVYVDRRVPENYICFYEPDGKYIGTIKFDPPQTPVCSVEGITNTSQ